MQRTNEKMGNFRDLFGKPGKAKDAIALSKIQKGGNSSTKKKKDLLKIIPLQKN